MRLFRRIGSVKAGNSIFREDWIDSGDLVKTTTHLHPMSKLFLGEVDLFIFYDNVKGVIWTLPALNIEIARELWTRKEGAMKT